MGYTINNDDLTAYTINESQKVFNKREQEYIHSTRLNKLIILISEELENNDIFIEDFVWGYYRHGFYSMTIGNYLRPFGEDFKLSDLPRKDVELPQDIKDIIKEQLSKISHYFVRDRNSFFEWVYGEITPKKYQRLYLTNRELNNWFEDIKNDLLKGSSQMNLFGKKDRNISDIISNYYFSLEHIEDEDILEIFRKFTDLVEFLSIKLNNNKNISKIAVKIDALSIIYKNIFAILTPYTETLHGDPSIIEHEKLKHEKRIQNYKIRFNKELDELYEQFEKEDLIPTIDELDEELLNISTELPSNLPTLREVYQSIESK